VAARHAHPGTPRYAGNGEVPHPRPALHARRRERALRAVGGRARSHAATRERPERIERGARVGLAPRRPAPPPGDAALTALIRPLPPGERFSGGERRRLPAKLRVGSW